ncbi:MAG: dTDP-4-dehydrorhamnose reductase [Thermoleophilia bacterium]
MTVLVTGAGGQLGRAALRELGADGIGLRHADLDVTDAAAVLAAAEHHRPTLILHAAAWTDVDGAETDRDGAYRANVLANRHVAEAAKAVGARLVTVSTDFVFDGRKGEPYVESDATGPISYYGETKLLGEQAALEAYAEGTWVVRTAWVYDEQGTNFPRLIMRLSETRDVLRVVEDQVGSPTYAGHLAPVLLSLPDVVPAGVHHIAGSGAATRREWAEAVLAATGKTTIVEGATSDEFPTPAERPAYSALGSKRAETPVLPPWRLGVAACMAGYVA